MSYYGPERDYEGPEQHDYRRHEYGSPGTHPLEPPEATSIKSMLNIAGILALVFGIIFILVAVWQVVWMLSLTSTYCGPYYGYSYYTQAYCDSLVSGARTSAVILMIVMIIFTILDFVLFFQCRSISAMVDKGQYVEAKSKCLLWMILGFIFCGIIPGILMLIAYLKFDDLIRFSGPGQYPTRQRPIGQDQYPQRRPPQYEPSRDRDYRDDRSSRDRDYPPRDRDYGDDRSRDRDYSSTDREDRPPKDRDERPPKDKEDRPKERERRPRY